MNAVLAGPIVSEGVGDFVRRLAQDQGTDVVTVENEFLHSVRPTSLLKRFAIPEEVAAVVASVCSP